jgi:transposase InsO family protein
MTTTPATPLALSWHVDEVVLGDQELVLANEGATAPGHLRDMVLARGPIQPNAVWVLDFQFGQTADGRMLHLKVIDESTRECLAIDVGAPSTSALHRRRWGAAMPRPPDDRARSSGPTCASTTGPSSSTTSFPDWCRFNDTDIAFIDPGSPW